jgi:hypothetical protein
VLLTPHGFILEGFLTSSSFDYLSRDRLSRISIMIMFVFGFFLPMIFIIVFVVLTKKKISRRSVKMCNRLSVNNFSKSFYQSAVKAAAASNGSLKTTPTTDQPTLRRSISEVVLNESRPKRSRIAFKSIQSQHTNFSFILKREARAMKTILLCVGMFLFAWLPYVVMVMCAQFAPSSIGYFLNPYTTTLPSVFAKVSSMYNPIIYTLSNRETVLITLDDCLKLETAAIKHDLYHDFFL